MSALALLKRVFLRGGLLCLAAWLAACAQLVPQTIELRTNWPAGVPRQVELAQVPFFSQTEYQCGPAALATIMNAAGVKVLPEQLVDQVYLPARHGSLQVEMLAAPRRYDLVAWQMAPRYESLLREVAAGHPVLVMQDTGLPPFSNWHYAVVFGFDYETGTIYLRSGETERQALPFTTFEATWRRSDYWAMVVTRPGEIPPTATESSYMLALLGFERNGSAAAVRTAWEAFLARWGDNPLAAIALGNRYYEAGDLPKAQVVLRRAAEAYPESTEVLNNLAQVLSELGRNQEALSLIDRAAQKQGRFSEEVSRTRAGILQRMAR